MDRVAFVDTRVLNLTFLIFVVTMAPILVGPGIYADKAWFASVDWPSYTPTGKFWGFGYLLTHTLLAYVVSYERRVFHNQFMTGLWSAQVLAVTGFTYLFFVAHNIEGAIFCLIAFAAAGVGQIFFAKGDKLNVVLSVVPACLFYGFASFVIYNTSFGA